MSDENQPPKAPAPMKKTSAVSLKKETVRVTLKPDPAPAGAPTPPPAPSAGAPAPPAPTIPLKTAGAPAAPSAPAPAPTIALKTAHAPTTPRGPSTVPLVSPPATGPIGGAGVTQPLPQATVQLQSTQQLGAPTAPTMVGVGTIGNVVDEGEENDNIPIILSIISFVLSIAVLFLGIRTWTSADGQTFVSLFKDLSL